MRNITIFDVMQDKKAIEKLNKKLFKVLKQAKNNEVNKEGIIAASLMLILLSVMLYFIYPLNFDVDEESKQMGYYVLISLGYILSFFLSVLVSAVGAFSFYSVFNKISSFFRKNKTFTNLSKLYHFRDLLNSREQNEFLTKFEHSLNKTESKYIFNFARCLNYEKENKSYSTYYDIFSKVLLQTDDVVLLENKDLLLEFIKNNFEISDQKHLIDLMTKTIEEKSIQLNIHLLDSAIEKRKEKEQLLVKENKVSLIKNI